MILNFHITIGRLWEHALALASHIDAATFHRTLAVFTASELAPNNALSSLYELYCNNEISMLLL